MEPEKKHVETLLKEAGMESCKSSPTPFRERDSRASRKIRSNSPKSSGTSCVFGARPT